MRTISTTANLLAFEEQTTDRPGQFRRVAIDCQLSVGATLRQAREAVGKPLLTYARKLNIPERYLIALEEEKFIDLPGLVYEKHFLVRYALALKLEAEPLLAQWIRLREGEAKPQMRFVPRVERRDLWISPFAFRRGFVALVLFLIAFYVGNRLLVLVQPPALSVSIPTESQVTTSPNLTIQGTVPTDAAVSINGERVPTSVSGAFSVPVTLEDGSNTIRIEAARRFGRPALVERHVFLTNDRSLTQSGLTTPKVIP